MWNSKKMMHAPYLALLSLFVTVRDGVALAGLRQQVGPETPAAAAQSSPESVFDNEPPLELPPPPESLIAMQFTSDPYADHDHMGMIQRGELGLAAIRYAPSSFVVGANGDHGQYTDIYGEFCVFDSSLNREDPANYPTMNAVMSASDHCGEHRYTMPLREVMQAVSATSSNGVKQLPVSGLLFHEGYSGAGLISNVLTTFQSTLVVSEHPAIRDALGACDVILNRHKSQNCSPTMQLKLVQDVVTLLSRTADDTLQHLFLKIPSASAAYLPELRSSYPDAKWAFVYRKAEDALAKATQHKRNSICIKSRRNPSAKLATRLDEYNGDVDKLSNHQVCALHLSTLLDAAISEHDMTGTGMLISYDDDINVNAIVDVILPYLGLQDEIHSDPQAVRGHVSEILSVRSNTSARHNHEDKQWNMDGEKIEVSNEVRTALSLIHI